MLDLAETASALGLGHRPGKGSAFLRAIERCCRFELARFTGDELEVRRRLPPLTRRQVERLPAALQQAHHREIETRPRHSDTERLRRRSRQLALSLVQLGEDLDATERQLHRWRFHPAMAHEAALWAWEHHHRAGAGRSDPGGDAA